MTPEQSVHVTETVLLANLYCFGEKYQDLTFKFAVIDAFIAKGSVTDSKGSRWYPGRDATDVIYKGTCAGSLARKLMVDMHVKAGSVKWLDGQENTDFLADLARKLLHAQEQEHHLIGFPRHFDNGDYHER